MDFYAVLEQIIALLQSRKRVTYGALKIQFQLTDDQLQVVKEELIDAQQVAHDEGGTLLVWIGEQPVVSAQSLSAHRWLLRVQRPRPDTDQRRGRATAYL